MDNLTHDLEVVEREGAEIGLRLHMDKSEIICANPNTTDSILSSLRGAQVVEPTKATLLGSSIGDVHSISDVLTMENGMLKRMGDRLEQLSAQDAILLVRHSFALPKLLYNLRTSPCILSPVLQEYDKLLQAIMGRITNIHFTDDDPAWAQATLPVKMGGLGIRSEVQLAHSAFLASAAASSDLVHHIIPPRLRGSSLLNVEDAKVRWCGGGDLVPRMVRPNTNRRAGTP